MRRGKRPSLEIHGGLQAGLRSTRVKMEEPKKKSMWMSETCLAVLVTVSRLELLHMLKAAKRLTPDGVLVVKKGVPCIPRL